MTPEQVLDVHRDVVVINGDKIALEMSLNLKESKLEVQRAAFAGERASGWFYLHRIDKFPDTVYECVVSRSGDAITSVYKNHRIFGTAGNLITARSFLCNAIAEKLGLSVEGVGIDDAGRGRTLGLEELSTGQLIDLLGEKMGSSIVVTDSHSAAGMGGVQLVGA